MKPQLSVRDLCFVALACGWWTEHRRADAAEQLAKSWRAEAAQSEGNLKLYRGLYAAVERSGFHIRWDLHGVPQGLIPVANFAGQASQTGRAPGNPAREAAAGP